MGGWGNATRHRGWNYGNWNAGGWNAGGVDEIRRTEATGLPSRAARWTKLDVLLAIAAYLIGREVGLVAFVMFKLWHQASGFEGNTLAFARNRWDWLVGAARGLSSGGMAMPFRGLRSSGNRAFDAWRETEFARIESERAKLRAAEHEFVAYHDELMRAKDSEAFERFMQARGKHARVND